MKLRISGPLWGESSGHRWISLTKHTFWRGKANHINDPGSLIRLAFPRHDVTIDECLSFKDFTPNTTKDTFNINFPVCTENHRDADCFVLAILSHAEGDNIYGTDGPIWLETCILPFKSSCESLAGKPKIFIVQVMIRWWHSWDFSHHFPFKHVVGLTVQNQSGIFPMVLVSGR